MEESQESKTVLGMIALESAIFPKPEKFIEVFEEDWGISLGLSDLNSSENNATVLQVGNQIVALMFIDKPVPWVDLEQVCKLAYYWPEAAETLKPHQAHIVVSVMSDEDGVTKYNLLTKVNASLLKLSPALGVYMGTQNLVMSTERYLEESELIKTNALPISLWVYFGLYAEDEGKISGYTYGLSEFGKMELEVSHSEQTLTDIYGFLYNISHYLLAHSPVLKDGETIGMTAEQKVMMTHQPSRYLDNVTVIDLEF
ncbi:DUF4261 domain-containing protein [uncultured Microscilla sp.]|uniref:DUF4261 domain-containing protein n=1 Tax=uncultured Microscilla sp. TaxID=432653 RepID=UPI002634A9E1|nr:DUF4261 domain-containing protein [uncultured Microscilla sp.]